MVPILGRPFLAYQIEQLKEQGFRKILLLLGYLPDVIREYLGDGTKFGLQIEYSVTPPDYETGLRLKAAAALLDPTFLLLYCDNYWPMQMDRMWPRFESSDALGMITVYANEDGYTKDCVRVDSDGHLVVYDKSRLSPGLKGVEISYAFFDRAVVELLPDLNVSVEEALYEPLVRQKKLLGFVTKHRYYSVGSPERLAATEAFFRRTPTVILDRDGTLNRRPPRAQYVTNWEEFEWLPGALEALRMLKEADYRVILATNQPGIAKGMVTREALDRIHWNMREEAVRAGGNIDHIFFCPHDWDEGCECRKPRPGLLFQAQRQFDLDLSRTPFIGDDERDVEAAEAAGCPPIRVSDDHSLLDATKELLHMTADVRGRN